MEIKKYKRGYTAGVFDMFHIGHLNVIKSAKELCEYLIVAVSTDEVVLKNKHKLPVICFKDRFSIISSLKYVDEVVAQNGYDIDDKIDAAIKYGVDVMFVGSDWKGSEKWNEIERKLSKIKCDVVYIPHTDGISSTMLRKRISK